MTAGSKRQRVIVRVLEIAVLAAVGVLAWSNYTLRTRPQHSHPTEVPFYVGDRLGHVPVVNAHGVPRDLDFSSGRTLVAILNPSCSTCVTALTEISRNRGVPAVILGSQRSQGLPALTARFQLADRTFTIAGSINPKLRDRFVVNPQLFIVDEGKVVRICHSVAECR
jgi:hypothetical protein